MKLATSQLFDAGDLILNSGTKLPAVQLAYETWGELSADRSNAILMCHGYTNHQHTTGDKSGWWPNTVGPGCAVDTNKYFVVCVNMLGSAYGSTGPASTNPATGVPYGPDFPETIIGDLIAAQITLLDHFGIDQLAAVIGFSYGGMLTFEWAHRHPDRMRALVIVASGMRSWRTPQDIDNLRARFANCADWNDGHYYEHPAAVIDELKKIRLETLTRYGIGKYVEDTSGETAAPPILDDMALAWARQFDANALIGLGHTTLTYDARPNVGKIKAPLLYVLSSTDLLFGPELAQPTMAMLKKAGVDASYFEIDSIYGHYAPSADWQKWEAPLQAFLTQKVAK